MTNSHAFDPPVRLEQAGHQLRAGGVHTPVRSFFSAKS